MTTQRHFGTIRGGEEVVIAGHNKSTNACLIVRVNHLPQDEAADLRRIAMSSSAQNLDYLIPTLRVELHKSGQDWFTHLATRLYRNDGAVANISLKEIEDMNAEQKAFFKGYGAPVEPKGGPSQRVGSSQEFSTPIVNDDDEIVVAAPLSESQAPANLEQARAQGLAPTPKNDPEMARVAAQASGGSGDQIGQLAAAMATLAEAQTKQAAAMEAMAAKMKPAPRRKAAARKKPAAKKTA